MAPKRERAAPMRCDEIQGTRFSAPQDIFTHNWWDVFFFPYILCCRLWDCFVTLCSGTNLCLVYWMAIQWIVCKITRLTTPNPIFPYYFYMFCQVLLLTVFFVILWIWFGKSVLTAYYRAFYDALTAKHKQSPSNTTRLSFRRYCFRKSELFDTAVDNSAVYLHGNCLPYYYCGVSFFVDYIIQEMLIYGLIFIFLHTKCSRERNRFTSNTKVTTGIVPQRERKLISTIMRRKLAFFGHLQRVGQFSFLRLVLEGILAGKRAQGHQRRKWLDNLKGWTGLSYPKLKELTLNQ